MDERERRLVADAMARLACIGWNDSHVFIFDQLCQAENTLRQALSDGTAATTTERSHD